MRRSECDPARLGELLAQRGMSPEELSDRSQIALPTIRAYLGGKRAAISTRNLLVFAQVFDIPMAELMDFLARMDNIDKK